MESTNSQRGTRGCGQALFRGGHRGRGSTGGYFNPQSTASEDDKTFLIHPRTKFRSLGITPADVTVEEVGFYSAYGDLDRPEDLKLVGDRTLMRSMVLDCNRPGNEVLPVDFNLDKGYTSGSLEGILFKQQLPILMKWAATNGDDPKLVQLREKVEIVSTCSLLADLMQGLYNIENWAFGAAKVNGKVVVGNISRPDMEGITQDSSASWHIGDQSKYRGRRFERYMTEEEGSRDTKHDKVAAPRFRTVLHTQLRDLHLLLASGVDAADPRSEAGYPEKYVDFVTCSARVFTPNKERQLFGRYLLRWWTNNVFGGSGKLHIGVHDDGHVTQVKTFRVSEIPMLVQAKEHITKKNFWDPNVCLGYVHALLKFVQQQVVKPHDRVVYEFTSSREEGRFTVREIPMELAKGHDYILGQADGFLA